MNFCFVFLLLGCAFGSSHGLLKNLIDTVDPVLDLLKYLETAAVTWKAAPNDILRLPLAEFIRRLGLILIKTNDDRRPNAKKEPQNATEAKNDNNYNNLPAQFDSRDAYKFCPSIGKIRDQSSCGSCWAVAVASVASDRRCISTNGTQKPELSAQELLSCCKDCKADKGRYNRDGDGCQGGYLEPTINYCNKMGIVTGGDYASEKGCQPYEVPPCTSKNGCGAKRSSKCKESCTNPKYEISYWNDKRKGSGTFEVLKGEKEMQKAIYELGSILCAFLVHSDFPAYKSGVYKKTPRGIPQGGHAVRCIGWGTENGIPYWLIANSWGTSWGEDGTFKMLRGENHCGIENQNYAIK